MNLKQESMNVKEYNLKFIQLSRYAPEMIPNMRAKMRKFVSDLAKHVKKEGKAALLNFDMDFSRLVVYLHQVEEDKRKDREEQMSKRAKSAGHENKQKQGKGNKSFFKRRSSNYAPSSASAPAPSNRYDQKAQSYQNS